jgi:hypothetical protein
MHHGGVGDRRLTARDRDSAAVDENVTGRVAINSNAVVGAIAEHG